MLVLFRWFVAVSSVGIPVAVLPFRCRYSVILWSPSSYIALSFGLVTETISNYVNWQEHSPSRLKVALSGLDYDAIVEIYGHWCS